MLRDLKRDDWLRILGLPRARVPAALILRGTRNLKQHYGDYRARFANSIEVGSPNGLFEDILIGEFAGAQVAYASVYGAAMASEVAHVFGVLGTKLVLQSGCCGAWKPGATPGDLFLPTHAGCGEGAAQYYIGAKREVAASLDLTADGWIGPSSAKVHGGRIYTTGALLAEGPREIAAWSAAGYEAVDMETATTLAVAEHFGIHAASVLFVYDNPRDHGDIILSEPEKDSRRRAGNEAMIAATFQVVERYVREAR